MVGGTLVARLTTWSFTENVSMSEWGDSDSAGFTNRKVARRDATGGLAGKLDKTSPVYNVFRAGDSGIILVLWMDSLDAVPDEYWYFTCIVVSGFALEFDQDGKEVVG